MESLFDPKAKAAILSRLQALSPASVRQWGKMDPAQALAHCVCPLELSLGKEPVKQRVIGKLLSWMVRKKALGAIPFDRNMPTDATFRVNGPRDLGAERERLRSAIEKFTSAGPAEAAKKPHLFFGTLSGDEWGIVMWKHVDHHLRQFGA